MESEDGMYARWMSPTERTIGSVVVRSRPRHRQHHTDERFLLNSRTLSET
jgi:hypothetical protein